MKWKFAWRLSMTKSEMKTCLSLKNRSFVIIALSYIFRNFFVELAIKLFTFFHTLFLTVDEIKYNELTKHVQKLQRNKFVKRFIECFVNNDKMKIVEMTLQFEQYFKSFNWIFHCNQIESKNNFNHLINSFELIVNLKMICNRIKQTNFESFENR